MAKTESTAIQKAETFAMVVAKASQGLLVARENMGDEGLQMNDLERIKIPSGGGRSWSVPTPTGDESRNEIGGVLIHHQPVRVYWDKPMEEAAGAPPACSSRDGKTGNGNPGGACATCPLSKFGSHRDGNRPACTEARALFLMIAGRVLPTRVVLPPTSLRPFKQFLVTLTTNSLPFYGVGTSLALETVKNAKNIPFSRVVFKMTETLDEASVEAVRGYRSAIIPALMNADVTDTIADIADDPIDNS